MRVTLLALLALAASSWGAEIPPPLDGDPPWTPMQEAMLLEHALLAEGASDPKVARAFALIAENGPAFLADPAVPPLAKAALGKTEGAQGTALQEILEAREGLEERGLMDLLKSSPRLRQGLGYYLRRADMLTVAEAQNQQVKDLFAELRTNVHERACRANMKTLAGASEMYELDRGAAPSGGPAQVQEALMAENYLRSRIPGCAVDDAPIGHDGRGFVCPNHGTAGAFRFTPPTYDEAGLDELLKENAPIRARRKVFGDDPFVMFLPNPHRACRERRADLVDAYREACAAGDCTTPPGYRQALRGVTSTRGVSVMSCPQASEMYTPQAAQGGGFQVHCAYHGGAGTGWK